jgi:hypothetical protein
VIISLEGVQGSGKSLTATACLYTDWALERKKVFSNNHFKFPEKGPVFNYEGEFLGYNYEDLEPPVYFDVQYFMDHIRDTALMDASILLDEGYIYLDSRTSSGKLNKLFGYFVVTCRKRGVDLYVCTHHIANVDKRLRHAVDIRGTCRYIAENPCKRCKGEGVYKHEMCPRCLGEGQTGLARTSLLNLRTLQKTTLSLLAPRFWSLYETDELIPLTKKQTRIAVEDL